VDRQNLMSGASDDWAYDHLGVFAWTTEFWDVAAAATGQRTHPIKWFLEHPIEDDLAMLRWNDEHFGGRLYVEWTPFDHPQLGPVEIGGWDWLFSWVNPPAELLEAEVRPPTSPRSLRWRHRARGVRTTVEALGDSVWRVRVVIHNTGWLPTTVTDQATRQNLVLPPPSRSSRATVSASRARLASRGATGRKRSLASSTAVGDGTPTERRRSGSSAVPRAPSLSPSPGILAVAQRS
jgi:hypothetical protein